MKKRSFAAAKLRFLSVMAYQRISTLKDWVEP